MPNKSLILAALAFVLTAAACGQSESDRTADTSAEQMDSAEDSVAAPSSSERLAAVLAAQPADVQARYRYRNPQETLEFFEVEPGMTIVEALPGGGWYTKILLAHVGSGGRLIGADYAQEMWPLFGFFTEEYIEAKKTWLDDFKRDAAEWAGDDGADASAFILGSLPEEMHGTADRVLFIRALHNLSRFEPDGGFLTAAITDAYNVLKPGGIVGVVQHQAPDDKPAEWADGSRGYLHKSRVIELMKANGFEFVGEIGINHNHKDKPGDEDFVWRLPPSLSTSADNPELAAELTAIGESHRMTLKFRKPD